MIQTWRWAIKKITGAATVPPSSSHKNGDWTANDIYVGELAIDPASNKIYTRGKDGVFEIGGAQSNIYHRKVRITAAEHLAAFTTPIELVPQPPSGTLIVPIRVVRENQYGGTAYLTNTTSRFYIQDALMDLRFGLINDLGFTANSVDVFSFESVVSSLRTEKPMMYSVEDGNPTTGNSDCFYHVFYHLLKL